MKDHIDLSEIVKNFCFEGSFQRAEPYGNGHINDTYAVYFEKEQGQVHRYILQRINHHVFKNPKQLMENIEAVTEHLRGKILAYGGDPDRETLNLVRTIKGESFFIDEQGSYWRAYIFIEDATSYESVIDIEHCKNAGRAFGRFQDLLSDFPADKLYETIPGFHDTAKRFDAFIKAVEVDRLNRAKQVREEISFIKERAKDTRVLVDLIGSDRLPVKVTHNDTKFNNIMIDNISGQGICVIDLDTVMPGTALYDFGDAIRFGASSAAEDEQNLSKVFMVEELYEQFTQGFLESVHNSFNSTELEYLAFSARLMTLECGMRFLTDFLDGDRYFKVKYQDHNLHRSRTQLKLVEDMEHKEAFMNRVVKDFISRL